MPRNSIAFWKSLLRKKLPPGCLSAVKFTTFGLGDSLYIKYVFWSFGIVSPCCTRWGPQLLLLVIIQRLIFPTDLTGLPGSCISG